MSRTISDQLAQQLKQAHPKVRVLTYKNPDDADAEEVEVAVLPPTFGQYRIFQKTLADDEEKHLALEQLLRDCVVWAPDAASVDRKEARIALDKLLEDLPGLAATFGGKLLRIAGLSAKAQEKKL